MANLLSPNGWFGPPPDDAPPVPEWQRIALWVLLVLGVLATLSSIADLTAPPTQLGQRGHEESRFWLAVVETIRPPMQVPGCALLIRRWLVGAPILFLCAISLLVRVPEMLVYLVQNGPKSGNPVDVWAGYAVLVLVRLAWGVLLFVLANAEFLRRR